MSDAVTTVVTLAAIYTHTTASRKVALTCPFTAGLAAEALVDDGPTALPFAAARDYPPPPKQTVASTTCCPCLPHHTYKWDQPQRRLSHPSIQRILLG